MAHPAAAATLPFTMSSGVAVIATTFCEAFTQPTPPPPFSFFPQER